jgi:FlaA1/EpsC-like NDP-sugar epimerase
VNSAIQPQDQRPERTWPGRIVSVVRKNVPLVLLDLAIVAGVYVTLLSLRTEGKVPPAQWRAFWLFLPFVAALHLAANYVFGLYGQIWRYASVQEARRVVLAGVTGGILVVGANYVAGGPVPRSVLLLGPLLSLIGFGGTRFQSRLFAFRRQVAIDEPHRVLLVGAGDAGAMLLRDILRNRNLGLEPVGFVDDDPRKQGLSLHGVRVLGDRSALPRLVAHLRVDQVLVAIPSATSDLIRQVSDLCDLSDVAVRVLPSLREVVGGKVTVRDVRDVRIEDILGREQVQMDVETIRHMLAGRRVLVTGAGGSIGSEIARQVSTFEPASLALLDHDETHLHDLMLDLPETKGAEVLLADIRDQDRMLWLFMQHRPEIVFHAAAHKHVPVLEEFPEEALRTNLIGTANVAEAALATDVHRFVLISTDKAVNPEGVMGASKRFAEYIVRSLQGRDSCLFCSVRFGNVLGSRGSVIPTFLQQIARGGPVTVTHPSMSRYFMSLPEAVQLVLQAAALSTGGEVFTLDMGQPISIVELAHKLIRLWGRRPEDVPIEYTGLRPGERLAEQMVDPAEETLPSRNPSIFVSRPPVPDDPSLRSAIRELEALASRGRSEELGRRMKELAARPLEALVTVP